MSGAYPTLTGYLSTLKVQNFDIVQQARGRSNLGLAAVAATGSASDLTVGTLPDARLSSNVPLKNAASNVFTGAATFGGQVTVNNDLVMTANTLLARQVRVSGAAGVQYSTTTPATGASGNASFMHYTANLSDRLYLYDLINGRNQVTYLRGTTDALALAQFHSRVTVDNNLTVGDGTAYGVALKGNITGSRITLNPSGMKAMYSYADATYAGWVNNSLSTGEYYYFGGGGHYFGHNGSNLLALTGSGATFSGTLGVVGRTRIGSSPGNSYPFEVDGYARARVSTAIANGWLSENSVAMWGAQVAMSGDYEIMQYAPNAGQRRFSISTDNYVNLSDVRVNTSSVARHSMSIRAIPSQTSRLLRLADANDAEVCFVTPSGAATFNSTLGVAGAATIGGTLQIGGASGHLFGWNAGASSLEVRDSTNTFYRKMRIGELQVAADTGGSFATPGNARIGLMTQMAGYLAGAITGRTYSNNALYGDVIISASSNINTGQNDYSNLTDDLVVRGQTGHVEINRGRLILNDTVNPSSWALKTSYNTEVGQLQFINNSSVAQMILSQSGSLTVNGAATFAGTVQVSGSRPIVMSPSNGIITIQASAGGWANDLRFLGSGGTHLTGFGASGSDNTLNYAYIGTFAAQIATFLPTGNVGIGATNPLAKFHVRRSSGTHIRIGVSDANADTVQGGIDWFSNDAGTPDFFGTLRMRFQGGVATANRQMQFLVADSINPKMAIDGNGLVTVNGGSILLSSTSGALLKNSSGTLQVRNSADSAFTTVQAFSFIASQGDSFLSINGDKISTQPSSQPWLFLTGANTALGIKVGSLVVSNSYSDIAPTNGLFVKGNTQIVGTLTLAADVWHGNSTNPERLYFATNAGTAYMGYGATPHLWRNNMSTDIMWISSAGHLSTIGHITSAFQSLSADPSTLDISSGMSRLVKNTTSGEIRHWVNDGGTMKKSPAYT